MVSFFLSYPVVLRRLLAPLRIILALSIVASAQFDTGTIVGSVTDPTGAVIPAATITITNVGTSVRKALQTDSAGNFVASAMPSGSYLVSATASSFAETKSQ